MLTGSEADRIYTALVTFLKFLMLLALVAWIGGIVFFGAVVAPTVFMVLPTHDLAGKVVSRSLWILHYIGIVSGVIYLICSMVLSYRLRGTPEPFALRHLAIVLMLAVTIIGHEAVAKPMLRLRDDMGVIDTVPPNDPRRVEFNRMHVWSTRIEETVLVLGLGVLWGTARRLS
ncbi:hypothetical protein Acid345_3199 [Candidatus Koribacter versatilis Ellin345]|uniref:TMEM205-like domain-containing protein n=1 Tax=Koribacter versatilis (strain Ellin345) TaxID=204669 RepID=Q1ILQ0_KORVE|nr:DUF4149 domain-containing protein [Candidatus Koribacter versatilis]ABF42200.1 hypothetical protein Acid345_3199 [Candidatus Koribacter versatilis Ellin345]